MLCVLVQTPRHEMTGCTIINWERLIFIKPSHTQSRNVRSLERVYKLIYQAVLLQLSHSYQTLI